MTALSPSGGPSRRPARVGLVPLGRTRLEAVVAAWVADPREAWESVGELEAAVDRLFAAGVADDPEPDPRAERWQPVREPAPFTAPAAFGMSAAQASRALEGIGRQLGATSARVDVAELNDRFARAMEAERRGRADARWQLLIIVTSGIVSLALSGLAAYLALSGAI